jgi:DNA-binding response OmpR family regulator
VGTRLAQILTDPRITRPHDAPEDPVEVIYIGGDPGLADLYRVKLEMDGYSVRLAPTGDEGLAQARGRMPDIMFLDLGPADPGSVQILRSLRRDRELKNIPVIVLWRDGSDATAIERLQLGVKEFLVKRIGNHGVDPWANLLDTRPEFRFAQ